MAGPGPATRRRARHRTDWLPRWCVFDNDSSADHTERVNFGKINDDSINIVVTWNYLHG